MTHPQPPATCSPDRCPEHLSTPGLSPPVSYLRHPFSLSDGNAPCLALRGAYFSPVPEAPPPLVSWLATLTTALHSTPTPLVQVLSTADSPSRSCFCTHNAILGPGRGPACMGAVSSIGRGNACYPRRTSASSSCLHCSSLSVPSARPIIPKASV